MSFQEMKESLVNAYANNDHAVFMRQTIKNSTIIGDPPSLSRLRIPVLSGLTGIGKTACIREFASEIEFELIELNCSYMPSSTLATVMFDAINRIRTSQIKGCVLLIDCFNEADKEWQELLLQYANNYFDAHINIAEDANKNHIRGIRHRIDEIPGSLFIVGEQRPI